MRFFVFLATVLMFSQITMAAVNPDEKAPSPEAEALKIPVQVETSKVQNNESLLNIKRFTATAKQESYSNLNGMNTSSGDTETDYSAALTYKMDDKTSLQAYYEFDTLNGWNGNSAQPYDKFGTLGTQDPYLAVSRSNVLQNSAGINVDTQARVYLPISADSGRREQIAQIRFYGTASKDIAKGLKAAFTMSPRFFLQQQDTYTNVNGNVRSVDAFRLHNFATLRYSFNDKLAVEQELGVYQMWFAGTGVSHRTSGARADYLDCGTSLVFTPTKTVFVQAGIRQSKYGTDLSGGDGRKTSNGVYSQDQSEYFLITSISI